MSATLPIGIQLAGPEVVLDGVNEHLLEYVYHLGLVHRTVFGEDLVITSGRDGTHVAHSLHLEGRAVDVRTHDKTEAEMVLFISLIAWSAVDNAVSYFDERALGAAAHVHLEYHGQG